MVNMISDTIKTAGKTLEERGIPDNSFFVVEFDDGSVVSERDINWSSISSQQRVQYFGGIKTVMICTLPVKRIVVSHGELLADLVVPEGCSVFQAIRSETVILDEKKTNRIIGRVVGLVKDGEVIEEQFLNEVEQTVVGRRK